MGHLEGLHGVSPHRTLELLPYLSSRAEYVAPSTAGDPFNDGTRLFGSGGLDLKYRPTSSLTLDGTINPDFGQVEVDPAVVNLTAFETFFEEKRPFFIEGANIFGNFGRSGANSFWGFNRAEPLIFYSRRIGRSPQGNADGDFVDRPSSTTILGAAKLTGKTRNGWSMGLLEAVTGRERAETVTGGFQDRTEVEPLSNYLVGRVQREKGRGAVGLIATAVNRDLRTPALRNELRDQAYVGGVDAHYFLDGKRDWVVTGQLAGSHVAGSTGRGAGPAARAAAVLPASRRHPPRDRSRRDEPARLDRQRQPEPQQRRARRERRAVGGQPGFRVERCGVQFQRRSRRHARGLPVAQPDVNRFSRRRSLGIAKWYTWNFARELQGDGVHLFGNIELKNYWSMFAQAGFFRGAQDDRATRGGPSMRRAARTVRVRRRRERREEARVVRRQREPRRNEYGGCEHRHGRQRALPSRRLARDLERPELPAQPQPGAVRRHVRGSRGRPRPSASRYVFGTLHQKEFSLQTRVNYVLSPKMSLQVYMQPLVSVGDYDVFKELARPRTYDFVRYGDGPRVADLRPGDRGATPSTPGDGGAAFSFDDPDFNFKSLRLNAIFRWEWRPGSALYFVWTEQREDDARPGRFALRRDIRGIFGAPADDVVLFKIAYWFQR